MSSGENGAADELYARLYEELRRRARRMVGDQPVGLTLQATDVVNEAFLKIDNWEPGHWVDRNHFFGVASTAMRQILVDHARAKKSTKRDHVREPASVLDRLIVDRREGERVIDMCALDDALTELANFDPKMAKAVELRYFAGLGVAECAKLVDLTRRTFDRHWSLTADWLHVKLS